MTQITLGKQLKWYIVVVYLIVLFYFIKYIFQFQFGGYDLSPLIDLCTRLKNNERPGVDFISTFPLSFLSWIKLNLLLFSNNYNFLIYSAYTQFVIFILFLSALFNNNKANNKILLMVILIASVPELITNHLWHNTFSQYNCILLFINICNIILQKKITIINYVIFLLFVGLTFFAKQNSGLLCVFLYSVIIIVCYKNKIISVKQFIACIIVFLFSTLLYFSLFFTLLDINLQGFIATYTSVAGRGIPPREFIIALVHSPLNISLILVCVIFSLAGFLYSRKLDNRNTGIEIRVFLWFNFFVQLVGYYCFFTNWDIKFNDYPLVAVSNLLVFSILITKEEGKIINTYYAAVLVVFIVSVYLGYTRERMKGVGDFYDAKPLYKINNGYLKGLYCGKLLFMCNSEILALKEAGELPQKTFFGPRIEFGYTEYNIPPALHMPLWWHPGSSYNIKNESDIVSIFENSDYTTLIFLKGDRTRLPQVILKYISLNYHKFKNSSYLDIYKKNK